MTNEEIKELIDLLQKEFNSNQFVLSLNNKNIAQRIFNLRDMCTHVDQNFQIAENNGFCKYCGRPIGICKN